MASTQYLGSLGRVTGEAEQRDAVLGLFSHWFIFSWLNNIPIWIVITMVAVMVISQQGVQI